MLYLLRLSDLEWQKGRSRNVPRKLHYSAGTPSGALAAPFASTISGHPTLALMRS